ASRQLMTTLSNAIRPPAGSSAAIRVASADRAKSSPDTGVMVARRGPPGVVGFPTGPSLPMNSPPVDKVDARMTAMREGPSWRGPPQAFAETVPYHRQLD